jgi:hypothetical protein
VRERCFVKVEFDPATSGSHVRRAVGGFLRYIQHRDLHPATKPERPGPDVAGLVKYVAYRDKASSRAELFGLRGSLGTQGRKDFVGFVTRSIEGSEPQLFRTRTGELMDRRRAVSRFLISPESAQGLDLQLLARVAVSRLESEMGVSNLRWIAAIHRNTAHHHVHLVLAGMRLDAAGGYRRVDITKQRLAAIKEALGLEIERQRGERVPSPRFVEAPPTTAVDEIVSPIVNAPPLAPSRVQLLPLRRLAHACAASRRPTVPAYQGSPHSASILALRAVARRYSRLMQREVERQARLREWELAA